MISIDQLIIRAVYIALFSIGFLTTSNVNANSLDSLLNIIDSSNIDQYGPELVLEILNESGHDTELLLKEFKTKALTICQNIEIDNCNNRFYTNMLNRLIDNGKDEITSKFIAEWKLWAEENGDLTGLAFSIYFSGLLKLNLENPEGFISDLLTARKRFMEINPSQRIIYEIDNRLAIYYRDIGDFGRATSFCESGMQGAIQIKDSLLLASLYNNAGRLYRKKSVYDSARYFYVKSLQINKALGSKRGIVSASNNLGNIYHIEGSLEKALASYIESKEIKEELNYTRGICISYHNIAAVRFDLKQYDLALKDFEKSLQMSIDIGHKPMQVHNVLKMGNVYRELGDINKAIENHEIANEVSEEINFEQGLIESLRFLGEDYLAKNSFRIAFEYFKNSLELAEKNNRRDFISSSLVNIAQCYMGFQESNSVELNGSLKKFSPDIEIEEMLLRGARIADEIDSYENKITSLEALRKFYRTKGDYKREAEISEEYLIYRDSLYEKQSAQAIAEWSTKYETTEKEKEIALLQKENELQQVITQTNRNKFIGILTFVFLGSLAFIIILFYRHKAKRIKQIQNLRTKISSDLHDDVGSILAGLSMQAELLEISLPEADKPKLQLISKLGRTAMRHMRDAVWAMDARKDSMGDLIDRMREVAAESLGAKEISYDFDIVNVKLDKKIRPDYRQNIYLIFKEALTNIIKHSNATDVKLNLLNDKDSFQMQIIDNGIVETKTYKTTGLGMDNMKMRAKRIAAKIDFKRENGFGVYISMPSL